MNKKLYEGFCEMEQNEILACDGGADLGAMLAGAGLVVASVALVVGTGGIGACSLPLILGAGTATEIAVAGTALVGSAVGGYITGYGIVN